MNFPTMVKGLFVNRDNRFRATVQVDAQTAWAHVPNSGRLGELFAPGRAVWLAPSDGEGRKTAYDLKLVEYASVLVSVDARLPNGLLAEALAGGRLPAFGHDRFEREVRLDDSRLDFRLFQGPSVTWVETKSVTLVNEGVAMFPDAPTQRGRRHLLTLMKALSAGSRAAVVFVVQRPDAHRFQPYAAADPDFAATLRQAAELGVGVQAYTCRVSLDEICLAEEIPVVLP